MSRVRRDAGGLVDRCGRPVPAAPVVHLRVDRREGGVPLLVDGVPVPVDRGADPHRAGLAAAARRAGGLGRPVRVEMASPWSSWPLVVHPDGAVDDGRAAPPVSAESAWSRRRPVRAPVLAGVARRPRRRPVGVVAAAGALAATLMVGAVTTGVVTLAAPAACRDVTLFAVNGTGAAGGETLAAVTDPLVQRVGERLAVVSVPGPEVGASYEVNQQQAVTALADQVAAQLAACPGGSAMLFGYSQGAHVAGDLAARVGGGQEQRIPAEKILAVGLFGDPARDTAVRTVPDGVTGQGVLPAREGGFGRVADRTIEVCAPEDPVCAARAGTAAPPLDQAVADPAHTGYATLDVAPGTPAPRWASDSLGRLITSLPAAGSTPTSSAPTSSSSAPTSSSAAPGTTAPVTTGPAASGQATPGEEAYPEGEEYPGEEAYPDGPDATGDTGAAATGTPGPTSTTAPGTGAGTGSGSAATTTPDAGAGDEAYPDTGSAPRATTTPGTGSGAGSGSGSATTAPDEAPDDADEAPATGRGGGTGTTTTPGRTTTTTPRAAGGETDTDTGGNAGSDTGALWALTSGLAGFQDSDGGNVEGGGLDPEEVESPNVPGRRVVKLEVPDGAKRSEVRPEEAQDIREGDHLFFGYSAFLPEDFPVDTSTWQVIWQLHDGGTNTSPPVALEVVDGHLWLANVGDRVRDLGPVQAGRNLDVQMDIRFEIGGGEVSVYRGGQQVLQGFRPPRGTMIDSSDFLKTGIYRDTNGPAEPATIFLNDLKIGDTLESVSDLAGAEQGTGAGAAPADDPGGGTDASNTGAGTGTSSTARPRTTAAVGASGRPTG
ncbi:heparin lyase I family protein [Actinomycetospora sp. CA-101289]|uniref:heparin lyase I family protein n=1 Tax=Actinomycetospora sp. CA-101289 TaxID=3239893 RepID=UPI003D960A84